MLSSAVTQHPNEVDQWWMHPVLFPPVSQRLNVFLRSAVWRRMISLPNQNTLSVSFSPLSGQRMWMAHELAIMRTPEPVSSQPPTHRPLLALYACDQAHWGRHDQWEQTAISPCLSSSAIPPSFPPPPPPPPKILLLQLVAKQHGESLTVLTLCAQDHFL